MKAYRLHGMMQSYFTRKMTGYLEYKRIPYQLRRFYGMSEESLRAGFPGGIPAVQTPDGEWHSSACFVPLPGRTSRRPSASRWTRRPKTTPRRRADEAE
ncbi:MAG TPA: glutathione S-transferase N-terminal domain-containing protein [Myxococcota bacterium]|nr:glutathione S-transferase N-terminal domain-containing protein [Myxococcota bacterium]